MTLLVDSDFNGDIYVYKMTCDNGGAPCIHGGWLSLSICKPAIRQHAKPGDWIIGFGGKSKDDLKDRLIYIAKITKVEENGEYYQNPEYEERPDCIYRATGNGYEYREGSKYHSKDDCEHDLGSSPQFDRARNLLSGPGNFVYLGKNPKPSIEESVFKIYSNLPRDFKKNHLPDDRKKLEEFIVAVFDQFGAGEHGKPTHAETSAKCNQSEDDIAGACPEFCVRGIS